MQTGGGYDCCHRAGAESKSGAPTLQQPPFNRRRVCLLNTDPLIRFSLCILYTYLAYDVCVSPGVLIYRIPPSLPLSSQCKPTVDTVKALRRAGKRTFFVTNNSSKSRRQYCVKLEGFGVHGVGVEDIVTSGSAIAGERERTAECFDTKNVLL